MGKETQLTLEQYTGFFVDPDRGGLTHYLLNQIVNMHGFGRVRRKKALLLALQQLALMRPARSTLRGGVAPHPCAALAPDEVKRDVESIGWLECPHGSIWTVPSPSLDASVSISSVASVEKNEKKRTKKKKKQTTVLISSYADFDCPMAAVPVAGLKKRRKKKRPSAGTPLLLLDAAATCTGVSPQSLCGPT